MESKKKKKKKEQESLLPFPTWRTGNISLFSSSTPHFVYTLSCYTKINPSLKKYTKVEGELLTKSKRGSEGVKCW
jgi:hypothetical protein